MAAPVVNSTHVLIDEIEVEANYTNAAGQAFGGASIITEYDADSQGGYGWSPTDPGMRSNGVDSGNADELGGFMTASGAEFGPIDGSLSAGNGKRLFYTHMYSSQGSALASWFSVGTTGYGAIFWLFSDQDPDTTVATDRTANCRGWCIGGSDSIPTFFSPHQKAIICVDPTHTASEVETGAGSQLTHIDVASSPNRFDPARIVAGGWAGKYGGGFVQTESRFGYFDAYTIYEGEAANPGTFQDFQTVTEGEKHWAIGRGTPAQFFCRAALEFGDAALANTQPTYFEDANVSFGFDEAVQELNSPLVRNLHCAFNKIGLESQLRSGDTFRLTNCQVSGVTPWHFRFNSTAGATVEFLNCILQNAGGTDDDCEIGSDVLIRGGLIDQFGVLSVNGGTLRGLAVTNPANVSAVEIATTSTLDSVDFSTETLSDYAIRIPDPAGGTDDYTLTDCTYTGFQFDIRVLGSSGTVNLTIDGGDTPTISVGTITTDTPVLLGSGWTDSTPGNYTAETSATGKRAVVVCVANNDSKLPTGVTFGGVAMTQPVEGAVLADLLEGTAGLSFWVLYEDQAAGTFSGAQTIAASYSGGAPSEVLLQAATYDNIAESTAQSHEVETDSGSSAGLVTVLDGWQSQSEMTGSGGTGTASYTISAGSDRLLVVVATYENNGPAADIISVTWGGQSLTEAVSASATENYSSIWYLDEAGIAAASGTTLEVVGNTAADDEPGYGAVVFSGVDQSTPIRDTASDTDTNPSTGAVLSIENGDMVVGGYASTGGDNTSSWDDELATPDATFAENTGDDPSEGAYKAYSGGSTTTGTAGATGGNSPRTALSVAVVQAAPGGSGAYSTVITTVDEDLVISGNLVATTPFNITWTGDATERDEIGGTNLTVSVADHVETADGTATMTTSSLDSGGSDACMVTFTMKPSFSSSGGPTVNIITNPVNVTVTAIDANSPTTNVQGARVLMLAAVGGGLPVAEGVSMTRSGSTVTVTHTAHGLDTGDKVVIEGTTAIEYQGIHQITVSGVDTYTYTIAGTPASPDSGDATAVIIDGLTDVNGEITTARSFSVDQPITGRARKGTSSPLYKTSPLVGTVSKDADFSATVALVPDE